MNYKVIIAVIVVAGIAYYMYNEKKKKDQAETPVIPEGISVVENPTFHEDYVAPSGVWQNLDLQGGTLLYPTSGGESTPR